MAALKSADGGGPAPEPGAVVYAANVFVDGPRPKRDAKWALAFAFTYVLALVLGGIAAGSANPQYDVLSSASSLQARAREHSHKGRGAF